MIFTLVAAVLFFVLGMRFGKRFMITSIISYYPAVVIHDDLPYITLSSDMSYFIALIVSWVAIYALIIRSIHSEFGWGRVMKYVSLAILSFTLVWIVILTITVVAPIEVPFEISSFLTVFMAQIPFGLTLVLPFLAMLAADRG